MQQVMLSVTCIDVWLSTSVQGSKLHISKNHLSATFNLKMVTIKQTTTKTHVKGNIFLAALHQLFISNLFNMFL